MPAFSSSTHPTASRSLAGQTESLKLTHEEWRRIDECIALRDQPTSFRTHVKWDTKSFNDLVVAQIGRFKPTAEVTREHWMKVARTADEAFQNLHAAVLIDSSFELLTAEVSKQIEQALTNHPKLGVIQKRVLRAYSQAFGQIRSAAWRDTPVGGFLELYRILLDTYETVHPESTAQIYRTCFPEDEIETPDAFHCEDIDVELPFDRILDTFRDHGVLQLREIPPQAKILIIGCGNGRVSNEGNLPLDPESRRQAAYSLKHNHPKNCATIDFHLSSNPTFLAFFGTQEISPLFRGKKFDLILFEGRLPAEPGPFFFSDLRALLSTGGAVCTAERDLIALPQEERGDRDQTVADPNTIPDPAEEQREETARTSQSFSDFLL